MNDNQMLLGFALGTLHAVVLTLAVVLSLYLTVDAGKVLGGLNTVIGLAVFAALWGSSVYCTYRAIGAAGLVPGEGMRFGRVLASAETWGAWNGMAFFWLLFVGVLVAGLVISIADGGDAIAGVLVFGFSAAALGTVVAAIAGAALGSLLALVDVGLLWAAQKAAGAVQP